MNRHQRWLAVVPVVSLVLGSALASARERGPSGMYPTGTLILRNAQGPRLAVSHEISEVPKQHTPAALVAADVNKELLIVAVQKVPSSELRAMVTSGFARRGVSAAEGTQLTQACDRADLAPGTRAMLRYDAATKTTTFAVNGVGKRTLTGAAAMRAVWSSFLEGTDGEKMATRF